MWRRPREERWCVGLAEERKSREKKLGWKWAKGRASREETKGLWLMQCGTVLTAPTATATASRDAATDGLRRRKKLEGEVFRMYALPA